MERMLHKMCKRLQVQLVKKRPCKVLRLTAVSQESVSIADRCFVGQVTCYAHEWSFGTLTSDWRPIPKSEGMTAASKTAVDTGSDTQFTKVSPYVRDIRKAWDVQVREIAQRREELGTIIPTAEHVVLSWRIGNRK